MTFAFAATLMGLFGCGSEPKDTASDEHHHGSGSAVLEDANFSTEATTEGGTWTLSYETDPNPVPLSENFSMTVTVHDADGRAENATLDIDATMPAHNHGMNTEAAVTSLGDGTFEIDGLQFHMTGHWRIHANVDGPEQPEEYAWFDVTCCD